jgi:hypothetical protein
MTDEDIEKIRTVVREAVAPIEAEQAEHTNAFELLRQDVTLIQVEQATHGRLLSMLQQDTRMVRSALDAVEGKLEILSGVAVRSDGTAQEVGGIRRMLEHLERRVRSLEDQTPTIAP